jgi:hypothetical protein
MKLVIQCTPAPVTISLTPTNPPLHSVVEHLQVLPADQRAHPHKSGNTVVVDILYFQTANGKTKDSEHNNSKRSSNTFPQAQV